MKNRPWKSLAMIVLTSLLCGGTALAQVARPRITPTPADTAGGRPSAAGVAYFDNAVYQDEGQTPFEEEPAEAPVPGTLPPEGTTDTDPLGSSVVGDYDGAAGFADACDAGACRPRGKCGLGSCKRSFTIGGWIEQGITANAALTPDGFNGPVTFNDRDAEWQGNQAWVFAEKAVDNNGCGWDVGGRVDFFYGTDARFTQARGLETRRDGSDRWNSERFYGMSLPQVYMDVAYNDWTVRMGRFFTIIGYETIPAPENFFYSHAYVMQYGEPFTHTGLLATYRLNNHAYISGGFDRGWDNWEDNNDDLSFLGGMAATSHDGRTTLGYSISVGRYDDAGQHTRSLSSIVLTRQVTNRLMYVLQHDYGVDRGGGFRGQARLAANAEWYGLNQYLIYELNPCWSFGARLEWFRDDDGARVGGLGSPHGWTLGPDQARNQQGFAGNFYEITLGLNWRPTEKIVVRPECRWDWYEGPTDASGRLPFDFGTRDSQFTFGTDLIVVF